MADEISDKGFKEEILRLLKFAVVKVGENTSEIALLRKDIEKNTTALKSLKKEVRENSGAFTDARLGSSEMICRLWEIEKQVDSIAEKFPYLKEEYDSVNSELISFLENIGENFDAEMQLDELNFRVENLEEKAFA